MISLAPAIDCEDVGEQSCASVSFKGKLIGILSIADGWPDGCWRGFTDTRHRRRRRRFSLHPDIGRVGGGNKSCFSHIGFQSPRRGNPMEYLRWSIFSAAGFEVIDKQNKTMSLNQTSEIISRVCLHQLQGYVDNRHSI